MTARRNAVLAAAAIIAILVAGAVFGARLHLQEDVMALLPKGDRVIADQLFVLDRFSALDRVYLDVSAENGDEETITAVADKLYDDLNASGLFERIHYQTSSDTMLDVITFLESNRPLLFDEAAAQEAESLLAPDAMAQRMQHLHRQLLDPLNALTASQVRKDPLGLDGIFLRRAQRLNPVNSAPSDDGRIWSDDGRHVLLIATPRFRSDETPHTENMAQRLAAIREACVRDAPSVRISYAAAPLAALDNAHAIKNDIARAMFASTVSLALLSMLFFRRWSYILLSFLSSAVGMALAAAVFGIVNPWISGISFGFAAAVMGITVDYSTHLLFRVDNAGAEGPPVPAVARAMRTPLLTAALTAMAAFFCLRFSSLPGLREMGLLAVLGVLGSIVSALYALPYLVRKPRKAARRAFVPLTRYAEAFLEYRQGHRLVLLALCVVVAAITVLGLGRVEFEGDMEKLNYRSPAARADETLIRNTWSGLIAAVAVVGGPSPDAAWEANERILPILTALRSEKQIDSVQSLAPLLPSQREQQSNLQRWRQFWSPERRTQLHASLERAATPLGFAEDAFEAFWQSLDIEPEVFELSATPLRDIVEGFTASRNSEHLIMTRFTLANDASLPDVAARLREAVPDARVAYKRYFASHISRLVRNDLGWVACWASLSVLACLYITLRRAELAVVAFIPIGLSVLVTLGVLGLLRIPVNMFNGLFIVLILGEGVDFSVFLLDSVLERGSHGRKLQGDAIGSVFISALTSVCGFGALVCASHPAFFSTGIACLVCIGATLLTSLLLAPELIRILIPNDGKYGAPSAQHLFGGAWALIYMTAAMLLYRLLLRPVVRMRHRAPDARARFARRYLRGMAYWLLRSWPYPHSERLVLDIDANTFKQPAVIVPNHQSGFDIMACLSLPVEMAMVVKKWVWNSPLMGRLVRDAEFVLAGEDEPEALLAACARLLKKGVSILMFPEGTRSRDWRIGRFHVGAFELACRTGCDVLPVLLSNTRACLPRNAYWIGDHRTVTRVLPRIAPQSYTSDFRARDLARDVKRALLDRQSADWRVAQDGRAFWCNLRSFYNYLGPTVETRVARELRRDPLCRAIDGLVPVAGRIVDVACGYGVRANLLALKSIDRQVLGIDIDEECIRAAQWTIQARPNITFHWGDPRDVMPEAIDAILFIDVCAPEPESLLAHVCEALLPGGMLVFRQRHCPVDTYARLFRERHMKLIEEHPEIARRHETVWVLRKARHEG